MRIPIRIPRLPLLLTALAVGLAGCQDFVDLTSLSAALNKEFDSTQLEVHLNDRTHMAVVVEDSPLGRQADSKRRATARKLAGFVRDHYAKYDVLEDVSVVFATSDASLATGYREDAVYTFTPAELGPGPKR
ncbi:MAG TPA: hypothetical protein VF746_07245 [Longimicrobium sp.]|jgi:hypothetical protein